MLHGQHHSGQVSTQWPARGRQTGQAGCIAGAKEDARTTGANRRGDARKKDGVTQRQNGKCHTIGHGVSFGAARMHPL